MPYLFKFKTITDWELYLHLTMMIVIWVTPTETALQSPLQVIGKEFKLRGQFDIICQTCTMQHIDPEIVNHF